MLVNMMDWQVAGPNGSETVHIIELFGDRYDFTPSEKDVLRLHALFGFQDEEIITIMRISTPILENLLTCMMGKTRTHSIRELQALFIRYLLQKLPT
ncbi:helix-turn-helix transcriptional regulator [Cohnella silvisoli]|uniref:HTH luxR-type domain-containing protein n=1 Tax=Cohnella silvisoli TaxID=2873699 RepID=A0ABV1KY42_9BACL|nr:hypothetical protein [Cohnella silvisoli]MCD9021857.1 hypothetical protein [Cohnella silvisoli]